MISPSFPPFKLPYLSRQYQIMSVKSALKFLILEARISFVFQLLLFFAAGFADRKWHAPLIWIFHLCGSFVCLWALQHLADMLVERRQRKSSLSSTKKENLTHQEFVTTTRRRDATVNEFERILGPNNPASPFIGQLTVEDSKSEADDHSKGSSVVKHEVPSFDINPSEVKKDFIETENSPNASRIQSSCLDFYTRLQLKLLTIGSLKFLGYITLIFV